MRPQGTALLARRQFLRALGTVAATTAINPLAADARADSGRGDDTRKSRYRESDHVKEYYRVNRYPG
jgi:hypothetical protein